MTTSLDDLLARGLLSALDVHFARQVSAIAGEARPEVLLAAALVSRETRAGHVCVELAGFGGRPVDPAATAAAEERWPSAAAWQAALADSTLVGDGTSPTPLVLRPPARLYLYRYWDHERRIAAALAARAASHVDVGDAGRSNAALDQLFPDDGLGVGQQRLAAELALLGRLCVVSGGPGTGKTSLVVKLIAALAERQLDTGGAALRTLLLAPTGKAAARLVDSVKRAKAGLACTEAVRAAIPERASTIHRALLTGRGERRPGAAGRLLEADLVVVDECSMVDVALMRRLLDAVPADARLVLLGDQHQLASVEAGAVFADICGPPGPERRGPALARRYGEAFARPLPAELTSEPTPPIADSVVRLSHSYRFASQGGIGRLARATELGDVDAALALLDDASASEVRHVDTADPQHDAELARAVGDGYSALARARTPDRALAALDEFRVLAAHRRGPSGVGRLNTVAEHELARRGLLERVGDGYLGQPVLVVENDYQLELFNGDVGVILPDASDPRLARAYFAGPDGSRRALSPARLPAHETVFAMSIHKSQGSEFDEVAVVLPDESSPLLTRELLYTAITRARRRVVIFGPRASLRAAIERRASRATGLADALWLDGTRAAEISGSP